MVLFKGLRWVGWKSRMPFLLQQLPLLLALSLVTAIFGCPF